MDLQEIKVGMQVAVARLNETDGMLIAAKHLVVRQVEPMRLWHHPWLLSQAFDSKAPEIILEGWRSVDPLVAVVKSLLFHARVDPSLVIAQDWRMEMPRPLTPYIRVPTEQLAYPMPTSLPEMNFGDSVHLPALWARMGTTQHAMTPDIWFVNINLSGNAVRWAGMVQRLFQPLGDCIAWFKATAEERALSDLAILWGGDDRYAALAGGDHRYAALAGGDHR